MSKKNYRSFRVPRIWSNEVLKQISPLFSGDIINVSGWDDRDKQGGKYINYFPNSNNYSISNYYGERGIDDAKSETNYLIDLSTPISDRFYRKYDVVFNHTTLEHVFELNIAIQNLCQMSRDIVIVIVPFIQEIHYTDSYGDYWRFTPMGLRRAFKDNGLEVIYETYNQHQFTGIYLFFVASRFPTKWQGEMPAWSPLLNAGEWVTYSPKNILQRVIHKLWIWSIQKW
ncbi:hypothetical protein ACFLZW_00590 [Chloroflexota bacterium]